MYFVWGAWEAKKTRRAAAMDEIKDITKRDHLSRFLDNRTLRVQPFGSNASADRAYSRAERLVAAIHLVTNHIGPDEPAREVSRRSGLELLSLVLMLREEMRNPESAAIKGAQTLIRKLISLVRILSIAGHVSVANAETLVASLDELAHFLVASQRTAFSESVSLSKEELLDTGYLSSAQERPLSVSSVRARSQSVKDKQKQKAEDNFLSNRTGEIRARADRIIGVLTTQGQLGIKDVVASLPEYSEKMIQRELKGLVSLGRVKKIGSKRWSIYALA